MKSFKWKMGWVWGLFLAVLPVVLAIYLNRESISSSWWWVYDNVFSPSIHFLFAPLLSPATLIGVALLSLLAFRILKKRKKKPYYFIDVDSLRWRYNELGEVDSIPYCIEHDIELILDTMPHRRVRGAYDAGYQGYICPLCSVESNVEHYYERNNEALDFRRRTVEVLVERELRKG